MTIRSVVDVVVHTHWDRERALPRETTLARLQAVMADVLVQLDSGELPSFLLDGQTVTWRDLLAVAPSEMAARLQHHARAGRLVLGPWYVSASEFLVSGESLLRNLGFGQADAADFAPAQRMGYLPDHFGHVAQMPPVLGQFAIHSAVLWRGAGALHDRFDWHAPDGTVVCTVSLTKSFGLHPLHGARPATAQHLPTLWAEPGPRQSLHGELRHDTPACVLPGVLGTRRPLKQARQQLEDEPALHARLLGHNAARDQRTRLLLPWCDDSAASTLGDTAFAITERPVRLAQIPAEPSRREMPVVVHPGLSTVVAGPLAVLHRALHEHEVVLREGRRSLALTLVRSAGWLSRRDLRARARGAGPDPATPGAQCLGEQVAEFRLLALQRDDAAHTALAAAQQMPRPLLLLRGHGVRWAATVEIGNPVVMTSSVRRRLGGVLELRLWKPTPEPQLLALDSSQGETVFADGRPHPGPVNQLAPFAIHTLRQRALIQRGIPA